MDFSTYENIKGLLPDTVSLMLVSKGKTTEEIEPFLRYGHRFFGENRVDEALEKWTPLKRVYPDINLHLIGHLQRNKVNKALEIFDSIDTLDSYELAQKVSASDNGGKEYMIEVNTGDEVQKSGISTAEADNFIDYCLNDLQLNIKGLMCVPPQQEEPSPHFAFLKQIADRHGLKELSMGMSADYLLAIQQGATVVRIGTLIFGDRT